MRSKLHWIALVALLLSLALNAVVFGALVEIPTIGQGVRAAAHFSSPLAWLYVTLGKLAVQVPLLHQWGESLAVSAWGAHFDAARATPQIVLDVLLDKSDNAIGTLLTANYYATPVLIVVWFVTWSLRPRDVHLVRSRRR